jgi:hypothetical protein
MRRALAALACCVALSAPAQVITPNMFLPSPLGIVLTVGQWIIFDNRRVYYIEVVGQGSTVAEARNNGFRLAVEQAIGTLISSETEVQNGRIVRDEIISYAAGFVDRFEIVKTDATPQGQAVTMRVWVGRSALADRLLNRSETAGQIDGAGASIRLDTMNRERATGDQLVATVLRDFPRRAFDIELRPASVKREQRRAVLEVPFVITWNKDYLRSLWTALEATGVRTSRPAAIIGLSSGSLFGFGGQARYDDTAKYDMIMSTMSRNQPAVMISLRSDHDRVLYQRCDLWGPWNFAEFSIYAATVFVDGSYKLRATAQIPVTNEVLEKTGKVHVEVVNPAACPKQQ